MKESQLEWSKFLDYTESNVKNKVPEKGGVYLIYKRSCFYVGQADNLMTRLLDHLSDKEENECIKNHVHNHICKFVYALVVQLANRDGIGKYLIDYFKTRSECNRNSPNVEPILNWNKIWVNRKGNLGI